MLSASAVTSAGGASKYYAQGNNGKYYSEGPGQSSWHGEAKDALGLSDGPVKPEEFENLLKGRSPDGKPLTDHVAQGRTHAPGMDFTFSAPKTVSILVQTEHGPELIKAIKEANHEAMTFMTKNFVKARITNPETGERELVGDQKTVYASFMEDVSRTNDPNIHIHNVIPNLVQGPDGKFRAMHNRMMVKNIKLGGAVFRASLAKSLRGLGYNLESLGKEGLFDVANIPADAKALFSKRRAQIKALYAKATHKEGAMDRIVLISRPSKEAISPELLRERWDAELEKNNISFEAIAKTARDVTPEKTQSPAQVLKGVVTDLSETKRAWTKFDILRMALMKGVPEVTAAELEHETQKQVDSKTLLKEGSHFSTPKIIRSEADVINQMEKGRLNGTVIANALIEKPSADGFALTSGQKLAGDLILSSRDRDVAIQGNAGVGKSTLVESVAPVIKNAGLKMIGIAPTSQAVTVLKDSRSFDKVMTLQSYVKAPQGDKRTVLFVDEASMVGTENMRNILQYANTRNLAKVVLMGDVNQHQAIERGTPFKDLMEAGIQTAHVDEIVRQKSERHREGVSQFARGDIAGGLKSFKQEIHEVAAQEITDLAVQRWKESNEEKTPIIVTTNRTKRAVNAAVKSSLDRTAPGYEHQVWEIVRKTPREKSLVKTYKDATHIRLNKDMKRMGLKRDVVYKIVSIDEKRHEIKLSTGGKTKTFIPAKYAMGKSTIELYTKKYLELHNGDRIRFTRGGRDRSVNNNDMGFVHAINDNTISIKTDDGKIRKMSKKAAELRHMDHGWATTGHSFQGSTVPETIVLLPSRRSPLTSLNSVYVNMSRHVKTVSLITDDAKRLQTTLEHDYKQKTEESKVFRARAVMMKTENQPSNEIDHDQMHNEERDQVREPSQETSKDQSSSRDNDYGR